MKPNVMELARKYADLSKECREYTQDKTLAKGDMLTVKYCGVMSDLIVETLQNLYERMHPVFDMATTNGILRQWSLEEITNAEAKSYGGTDE